MPQAPVNNSGAVIHYEDSGAPSGCSSYVTIVVVHGVVFHGASFLPLFQYAPSNNARVIALNLRDYPNSTPYNPSELDLLLSTDPREHAEGVRMQGLELAAFLKHIVIQQNLPLVETAADGQKTGGIVLLAWSLGNTSVLSMLANEAHIDDATRYILHRSLRTVIMYECPNPSLGLRLPDEIYFPGYDSSIPPDELPLIFGSHISSFFTPVSDFNVDIGTLVTRKEMRDVSQDPKYKPTVEQIPLDVLSGLIEPGVLERSARGLLTNNRVVLAWGDNAKRALFDCSADSLLNHADAVVLWGEMSCSMFMFCANYIDQQLKDAAKAGKIARSTRFVKFEGGNHLLHWHYPERLLRTILTQIERA